MLREMDLVEGDWAALFWALGSQRLSSEVWGFRPMLWF